VFGRILGLETYRIRMIDLLGDLEGVTVRNVGRFGGSIRSTASCSSGRESTPQRIWTMSGCRQSGDAGARFCGIAYQICRKSAT
jgi:hypothetical protein